VSWDRIQRLRVLQNPEPKGGKGRPVPEVQANDLPSLVGNPLAVRPTAYRRLQSTLVDISRNKAISMKKMK